MNRDRSPTVEGVRRDRFNFWGLILGVKDGKIWIQHDGTEVGIATQLLELGVPKQDIVLAFHSPYMRQFTEFAIN